MFEHSGRLPVANCRKEAGRGRLSGNQKLETGDPWKRATACAMTLLVALSAAAADLGDPTRPTALAEPPPPAAVAGPAPTGPRWHLGSTLVSEARAVAVINGRALRRGDRIDNATLVEIYEDRVTLDYEGRHMTVHLLPGALQMKRNGR